MKKLRVFNLFAASILCLTAFAFLNFSCSKNEEELKKKHAEEVFDNYKDMAVSIVHTSAVGLGNMLRTVLSDSLKVGYIRAYIDSVRFYEDKSGYFYVYDTNCVCIAHAYNKTWLGVDKSDYKDVKGRLVVKEIAGVAKKGGGFVEYFWIKPGAGNMEVKKLGYVEKIPYSSYFIGTGVYYPEVKNK